MSASHKLSHLLQLADQGPVMRAALAEEVAELLTAWPADYPAGMQGVCEASAGQGGARCRCADPHAAARDPVCRSLNLPAASCRANPRRRN